MVQILAFLNFKSRRFYLYIVLLSIVSSGTHLGILNLINRFIQNDQNHLFGITNGGLFIFLFFLSLLSSLYFRIAIVELSNGITLTHEISLLEKICSASYESFEKLGKEKIYAAVADSQVLGRIPDILISILTAAMTVFLALIYLFFVSKVGCLIVVILIVSLLCFYLYNNKRILKDLNVVRDLGNVYYKLLQELVDGFKQLKISTKRMDNFFNRYISNNRIEATRLNIITSKRFLGNEIIGTYGWYVLIGVIMYIMPLILEFSFKQTTTFITTLLFIMSPISVLINSIPLFSSLTISLGRVAELETTLDSSVISNDVSGSKENNFKTISFKDIKYTYSLSNKESDFSFQLPNLTIRAGELLYVTGSNGSGKTTFVKILTGLIKPTFGQLFLNDIPVDWRDYQSFSNNMSVVFIDQLLFQNNYDEFDLSRSNSKVERFTRLFELEDVFKVHADATIDANVSTGQKKRISLLLSLLEDNAILVLDEWAAEQDSVAKRKFYQNWLSILKKMGMTIIVISHDRDYFPTADRLLRFESGRLVAVIESDKI